MFGTRVVVTDHDGSADGYVYNVHTITRGRVAETGLDGRFNTGSVVHNVRASASWLNYKEGTANNHYTGWPQNIYDPVSPPQFPGDPGVPDFSVYNILTSYALEDTMDMANGKGRSEEHK